MGLSYVSSVDDGKTYDVDAIITVIICIMLHVCARNCFNAENVYNRAMSWLTTPGFFVSKNSEWADVAFMSFELSKCIDNDIVLRKILPRLADNWKAKLRIKSSTIVLSLRNLQTDFNFLNQDTQFIVRQAIHINLLDINLFELILILFIAFRTRKLLRSYPCSIILWCNGFFRT